MQDETFLIEIYENQRGTIIDKESRFSKRSLLPTDNPEFTKINGECCSNYELFQCPKGCEWCSDWVLDTKGDVDLEGWCYNITFNETSIYSSKARWVSNLLPEFISCVRRRKWQRSCKVKIPTKNSDLCVNFRNDMDRIESLDKLDVPLKVEFYNID
jgi:hypothetical protein